MRPSLLKQLSPRIIRQVRSVRPANRRTRETSSLGPLSDVSTDTACLDNMQRITSRSEVRGHVKINSLQSSPQCSLLLGAQAGPDLANRRASRLHARQNGISDRLAHMSVECRIRHDRTRSEVSSRNWLSWSSRKAKQHRVPARTGFCEVNLV